MSAQLMDSAVEEHSAVWRVLLKSTQLMDTQLLENSTKENSADGHQLLENSADGELC